MSSGHIPQKMADMLSLESNMGQYNILTGNSSVRTTGGASDRH